MSNKGFTIGSLFDGSGGFPLAATMCGGVPVWASEVEPYPIAVTKSRFPNMKHLGSVTDVKGDKVEPVDVITFGSPCQDLSVAGKRAGLKHEDNGDDETTRSGLFMEAVRIIKEMREATNGVYPRFAIWENVPGAFSSNKGEDFRTVCEELIKIVEPGAVMPAVPKNGWPYADLYCGEGWSLAYRVYDAQYWGVPQRRRRIYLVLDLGGQCAGKVSFEREGLRGYFETGRTPWQGTAPDAERGIAADDREGEGNCLTPWDYQAKRVYGVDGIAPTLPSGERSGQNQQAVCIPINTMLATRHKQLGRGTGLGIGKDGDPQFTISTEHCHAVAYTLKIRSGCEGGGKGALIQTDKSATLATNNDQYLFQPVYSVENHPADSRVNIDDSGKVQTLTSRMGTGGGNVPMVMEPVPIHDQATRFSGKRGDKQDGKGNGLGIGNPGDPMNTLTSGDRHAVVFQTYQKVTGPLMANSHPGSYTGQDAFSDMLVAGPESVQVYRQGGFADYVQGECGTLRAAGGDYGGGTKNLLVENHAVRYIVRRLTPTECARLQGFADAWAVPISKDDFTDDEYAFWLNVRNTHAEINGKATKEYTKEQMLSWYNKLHTDSSEYKLWGNGIALPTALYVMQGISDAIIRTEV